MHNKELVQVGADWCGPCKVLKPIAEELCTKLGIVYRYVDVESEEGSKIIKDNFFRSIPVLKYTQLIQKDTGLEPLVRYKVGGFDRDGVVLFLTGANDLNVNDDEGGEDVY